MVQEGDAYGRAMLDYYDGEEATEVVERDDGLVGRNAARGAASYFAPYPDWPERQREAMDHVEGRVLDVGCGAGRAMAHLALQGHDCLGIDLSPGAVEVCHRRGLDAREMDVTDVTELDGPFDTILMFGNNFGLVGTRERAPSVLGDLAAVASEDAVLLAESRDPYATDDPDHLAYQERNRERGRLPGALRIRIRYGSHATPWFDYLLASREEMRELVAETRWTVTDTLGEGDSYVGVLRTE